MAKPNYAFEKRQKELAKKKKKEEKRLRKQEGGGGYDEDQTDASSLASDQDSPTGTGSAI